MIRALLVLVEDLLRLALLPLWVAGRIFSRPRGDVLHIKLRPRLVELQSPVSRWAALLPWVAAARPTSLVALRRLAAHVARDPRIATVLVEVPPLAAGMATCTALRDVMLGLRAAGKRVVVFLPQGGGNREAYVASAADRVLMSPSGTLAVPGLAASVRYLKPLLDKVGVSVSVHARGEFKTAAEPLVRETMSDAQREQLGALLAAVDTALRAALAARPGMTAERVQAVFDGVMFQGKAAIDAGLVDALCYEDELQSGVGSAKKLASAQSYFARAESKPFRPLVRPRYVAVVPVHGAIAMTPSGPLRTPGAALEPTINALRAARRDRRAVGVVLHIDSPGGSALASDLIHREVVRLCEKKPVVACLGEVAASGGYYIAAGAAAIVAQPATITGSIGVISAKVVAEEVLGRLGVRVETLRTAPHADMMGVARPLTSDERAILDREVDAFYRTFVGVVARGRGRAVEEIEPLARGRVWSGQGARERGLVDRLGGFDAALDEVTSRLPALSVAARAALRPELVRVSRVTLPPPPPPSPRAVAALAAAAIAPELADLVALAAGGEHALCYALGLPEIA